MPDSRINFRRVFILVALSSMFLIYILLDIEMLASPSRRTYSDYMAYYAAGRISQIYANQSIYNLELQNQIEQQVLNSDLKLTETNPFSHPPLILPILKLLVSDNYVVSYALWQVFLFVVYVVSIISVGKMAMNLEIPKSQVLFFMGVMLFFPVYASIGDGQDTAVVFLGTVLLLIGFLRKRDAIAGLGLALTSLRPQLTLVLLMPFLFDRRRVLVFFVGWAAVMALLSLAIVGPTGIQGFANVLLVSSQGLGYRLHEFDMVNLIGDLNRIAPALDEGISRAIGWGAYFIGLASLAIWGLKSKKVTKEQVAVAFILALFTSPHTHYHDLALLLIPIFILILALQEKDLMTLANALLLPIIFSLYLLLTCFSRAAKFSSPSFLMLGLALWINFPLEIDQFVKKVRKMLVREIVQP